MLKTWKKAVSLVLVFAMSMMVCVPAFAASTQSDSGNKMTPNYVGTQTTYSWDFDITNTYDQTSGNWIHLYTGSPATRSGEYDTVSNSVSYTNTFSGTISGGLKDKIEASLGYSFSKSESFQVSRTSTSLDKGEYVKAYYKRNYEVSKIKQTETIHTYGFEAGYGGSYYPVDRYSTGDTTYVYAKRAIMPKIKLEYYSNGRNLRSAYDSTDQGPTLIEYYEYYNHQYRLVKTER